MTTPQSECLSKGSYPDYLVSHYRNMARSYREQAIGSGYVHAHDRAADLHRAEEYDRLADEIEGTAI